MTDGYEPIRRSLRFIETHLSRQIGLEDIARDACLSPWHFHRLFSGVVGGPPIAYLRRRRLSDAARRLASNMDESVLDIALAVGFESQAAFTRAFRRHYGLPPNQFRQQVDLTAAHLYQPVDPGALGRKETIVDHKMIDKETFTVVGMARDYTPETMQQIPQLWSEFGPRIPSIPDARGCYGLCIPLPEAEGDLPRFTYAACMEVDADAPVPQGMTRFQVPAARYAVFTFDGHISRIAAWVETVFGEHFPATGLPRAQAPELEYYDERFDPQTGNGQVDYYIPVQILEPAGAEARELRPASTQEARSLE